MLYNFRDKARYWSKSRFFHTLCDAAFDFPRYGGPCRNIAVPFCTEKREWCGYPMVKMLDDTFSRFDRIPRCECEGQLTTTQSAL